MGFLLATVWLFAYYLVACLVVPVALRTWTRAPGEVIRKTHHLGYGLSIWLMLTLFGAWYEAVAAAFVLVLVAYPALLALERWSGYRRFLPDRLVGGGELRRSMMWVQASFAANMALFWGAAGSPGKAVVAAGVMGWTFGDAAAALVGKRFGRRFVVSRFVDAGKTVEGSLAMATAAAVAIALTLRLYGGVPWAVVTLAASVAAASATLVELVSRGGTDTLTVPLAASASVAAVVGLLAWTGVG
ncbi:MAG: hypothetical protein U5J97_00565 [Trueperaceae bacterium]|nr:hypothetical protein [Trueperaceae bacterium]